MSALPDRPGTTGDDASENPTSGEAGLPAAPGTDGGANGDGLIRRADALAPAPGGPPRADGVVVAPTTSTDGETSDAEPSGGAGPPADGTEGEPDEFDDRHRQQAEKSRKRRAVRSALEWAVVIAAALSVAFVVKVFFIQAFWIPSPSMEPTLQRDDRVLANKLADGIGDLNRGDVIVFRRVDGSSGDSDVNDLIKRVIGLPGDVVESRDGVVYVNDQRLDEPYLDDGTRTDRLEREVVEEGHVYVMGDNRGNSQDSRVFGQVPEDNIVGRAFVRIWPPNRFGRL